MRLILGSRPIVEGFETGPRLIGGDEQGTASAELAGPESVETLRQFSRTPTRGMIRP